MYNDSVRVPFKSIQFVTLMHYFFFFSLLVEDRREYGKIHRFHRDGHDSGLDGILFIISFEYDK